MSEKIYHNGILAKPGQFAEPNGIRPGDRVRVVGEFPANRFDWEKLSHEWLNYVTSGGKLDTWAVVQQNVGFAVDGILVTLESVNGRSQEVWIHETEWKDLTERGQKLENDKKILENALVSHCIAQQKTPFYAPTALMELYEANKIQPGYSLKINGVDMGPVVDCVKEDGHIIVNTDSHLITSLNISNAYHEAELNVANYLSKMNEVKPIQAEDVKEFMISNSAELEKTIGHFVYVSPIGECKDFMEEMGSLMTNYMDQNNINSLSELSKDDCIKLSEMIACRLISHGFEPQRLPRPTQQELEYLQNLGYTEEAMEEKGKILSSWLKDKELTLPEKVAAMSIIESKVLHIIQDYEWGSAKEKKSFLGVSINVPADRAFDTFNHGGTLKGTHINMATGEIEQGKITIPECNPDYDYQDMSRLLARNENEMWTTVDARDAYQSFGGFDYQLALEMSQNGGKGQKADSQSVDQQAQTTEDQAMINHFDLIERGR